MVKSLSDEESSQPFVYFDVRAYLIDLRRRYLS